MGGVCNEVFCRVQSEKAVLLAAYSLGEAAPRRFHVADAVERPVGRTDRSTVLKAHILIKGRLHDSRWFGFQHGRIARERSGWSCFSARAAAQATPTLKKQTYDSKGML